jgi:hypothetical protein
MSFKGAAGTAAGGVMARAVADRVADKLWPSDKLALEDVSVRVQRQRTSVRDLGKWRWVVRGLGVLAGIGTAHGIRVSGRPRAR